jgi:NAD(P)-dependent dehydrogenase (short-subunit alcohol dehydrogenase family)
MLPRAWHVVPGARIGAGEGRAVSILERFGLDGKVAIVTGASSGLGVAFALALAEAGADIGLGARRLEQLEETRAAVEKLGRKAVAVQTDVTKPEDCTRLVSETVDALGRVDILVNNAGLGTAVPATREDPDEFRRVVDVNLNGAYWMAQACGRVMKPGSSIINIGSVLGSTTASLPQAAYSSTKAAILGLTRDLAAQWTGRKGIRVNTIAPGFFLTEMTAEFDEGYLDAVLAARCPAGRAGELEECAAAVVFLASPAASYISGAHLAVDGGLLTT